MQILRVFVILTGFYFLWLTLSGLAGDIESHDNATHVWYYFWLFLIISVILLISCAVKYGISNKLIITLSVINLAAIIFALGMCAAMHINDVVDKKSLLQKSGEVVVNNTPLQQTVYVYHKHFLETWGC